MHAGSTPDPRAALVAQALAAPGADTLSIVRLLLAAGPAAAAGTLGVCASNRDLWKLADVVERLAKPILATATFVFAQRFPFGDVAVVKMAVAVSMAATLEPEAWAADNGWQVASNATYGALSAAEAGSLRNVNLSVAKTVAKITPSVRTLNDLLDLAKRAISAFINWGLAHPSLLASFIDGFERRIKYAVARAGMSDGTQIDHLLCTPARRTRWAAVVTFVEEALRAPFNGYRAPDGTLYDITYAARDGFLFSDESGMWQDFTAAMGKPGTPAAAAPAPYVPPPQRQRQQGAKRARDEVAIAAPPAQQPRIAPEVLDYCRHHVICQKFQWGGCAKAACGRAHTIVALETALANPAPKWRPRA